MRNEDANSGIMNKNGKIRVLVADDHFVVRIGLIGLMKTEPDMEVIAEAADGGQAVERFAQCRPDLVLMDQKSFHSGPSFRRGLRHGPAW